MLDIRGSLSFYSCFISNQIMFIGAFLAPIFLVLIFNFIIYILVIRTLIKLILDRNKRKSNKYSMTKTEAVKLLLSSVGIICLFGLTWVFAVFTFTRHNAGVSFSHQFLFTFFNAFQGFYIFLFFVVLSSDAREEWRGLLCKCLIKEESLSKYELQSSSTKSTNVKSNKHYRSALHANKNGGNLEAAFALSKQFSQEMIDVNYVAFEEEEDNLPDILKLREKVLAKREIKRLSVNVPLPIIDEMKPSNENEYVTLPLGGITHEVKPTGDSNTKDKTFNRPRIKRYSTTRHTHHVEKADLDFFDDISDDDETIL